MSNKAKKFIHRSPRYIIQPRDEKFLRFVHNDETNRSYTTQIVNISETGLAFRVDKDCSPSIGDIIKVEFPIGEERVAWWAKVARLEEYDDQNWWQEQPKDSEDDVDIINDEIIVGIQFKDLPDGHSEQIQKELGRKFQDMVRKSRNEKIVQNFDFLSHHYWAILIYGFCAILTAGILYWLANPFNG